MCSVYGPMCLVFVIVMARATNEIYTDVAATAAGRHSSDDNYTQTDRHREVVVRHTAQNRSDVVIFSTSPTLTFAAVRPSTHLFIRQFDVSQGLATGADPV